MNIQDFAGADDRFVRRYAYDDANVVAVDLGGQLTAGSVDVIGDTVIVVDEAGDEQHELDVPGVSQAFIRNGVLTIEMEADA